MARKANIERNTNETRIRIALDLDGTGQRSIDTGIPFFDHMLDLFAAHGGFDLDVYCRGDLEIDMHHTVEDIGIALGDVITEALGDRKGICRYGSADVPMDETLCRMVMDLSNRPYLVYRLPDPIRTLGEFDPWLAKEFFRAVSVKAGITLHVDVPYGENSHHIIEAIFKAFGRGLRSAVRIDGAMGGVPSTKGML